LLDSTKHQGCEDVLAIFRVEELREHLGILTGTEPGWLHGPGAFLALSKSSCDNLGRSWRRAIHHPPGECGTSLFEELASSLVSVLPANATSCKEPASRSALVRRGIELIDAEADPVLPAS